MFSITDRCISAKPNKYFRDLGSCKIDKSTRSDFISNCLGTAKNFNRNKLANINHSPRINSGNFLHKIENCKLIII